MFPILKLMKASPWKCKPLITIGDTIGNENAPTPIAIIGLPAGLEVLYDQLKELVGAERISTCNWRLVINESFQLVLP